jgi:hypothetical protein
MRDDVIRTFLERYGEAIGAGDVAAIARCWEVPALVLADQGAIAVNAASEIEAFFRQAREAYAAQGLVATRPQLERVEALGDRLAAVDVRWPAFDEAGTEPASERSHYILWLGDDGEPRIRVALTRAA